jgi:hypothetical protein
MPSAAVVYPNNCTYGVCSRFSAAPKTPPQGNSIISPHHTSEAANAHDTVVKYLDDSAFDIV